MSMHEIEGLVEDSVHAVAKSQMKQAVKRDFLYNLYRFQTMFDTGYTHFRLIDTLLELKFTYPIPLEKHPDYLDNQEFFKALDIEKTIGFLLKLERKVNRSLLKKKRMAYFCT